MVDVLAMFPKEVSNPDDASISIWVQNCHVLAPISLNLINSITPVGQVAIINKDF